MTTKIVKIHRVQRLADRMKTWESVIWFSRQGAKLPKPSVTMVGRLIAGVAHTKTMWTSKTRLPIELDS